MTDDAETPDVKIIVQIGDQTFDFDDEDDDMKLDPLVKAMGLLKGIRAALEVPEGSSVLASAVRARRREKLWLESNK